MVALPTRGTRPHLRAASHVPSDPVRPRGSAASEPAVSRSGVFPAGEAARSIARRGRAWTRAREGLTVASVGTLDLGRDDERTFTSISTTVSRSNLIEALLPSSLNPPKSNDFNHRLLDTISKAKNFIFIEGFDLGREDLVDALIKKAREGVQVVALFDAVNEPREKVKGQLLDKMREAAAKDPKIKKAKSLYVAEYQPIPTTSKSQFEQILHVKRVIADTPAGTVAEVSGGINFGKGSFLNLDTAWHIEGVAALDSLQRLVEHYPVENGKLPFDLSIVPTAGDVRAALKKKNGGTRGFRDVEIAGAGRRLVEAPRSYPAKKLKERVALGRKLVLSSKAFEDESLLSSVTRAVLNGSLVKVVEEKMSAAETRKFDSARKSLDELGVVVLPADAVIKEDSYPKLVDRELEEAIRKKESIDVAAFVLTDSAIIDRLIEAHEEGCKVRVVVDDLTIDNWLINSKALALLRSSGIEVRAVTPEVVEKMKLKGRTTHNIKLHAKAILLGGNRVLGGSSNFSNNGLTNNVEDGRLVRSREVAETFRKQLFDPMWDNALVAEPLETVTSGRVSISEAVPLDTKVKDLSFVVFDLETTGFAPHHDDRIVSLAAQIVTVDDKGEITIHDEFNQFVDPGWSLLGTEVEVPGRAARIHGLSRSELANRGARSIRDVVPDFVDFIEKAKAHGKVLLAGHNIGGFDLKFLDQVLSRKPLEFERNGKKMHYTFDAPYLDSLLLSQSLFPQENAHDLDSLSKRLKTASQSRGLHDALEDVQLTAAALGKLIAVAGGEDVELRKLLREDKLEIRKPILASRSGRGTNVFQFDSTDRGKLVVREKGSNGRYGDPQRVLNLEVRELVGDKIRLAVTSGTPTNNRDFEAFVPAGKVGFRADGSIYHALRERGVDPGRPGVLIAGKR